MKVSIKHPSGFQPVPLTITFESQSELDVFHALLNHTTICSFLEKSGFKPGGIRDVLASYVNPDEENQLWINLKKLINK